MDNLAYQLHGLGELEGSTDTLGLPPAEPLAIPPSTFRRLQFAKRCHMGAIIIGLLGVPLLTRLVPQLPFPAAAAFVLEASAAATTELVLLRTRPARLWAISRHLLGFCGVGAIFAVRVLQAQYG